MTRRAVALVVALFLLTLSGAVCDPTPPLLTPCGTWGGECTFDLVPQTSASLSNYRPTVVWPKLHLTWSLAKPWEGLDEGTQRTEIQRALDTWAAECPLTFSFVDSGANITITFESGDLGDGTRFDQFSGTDRNEMARAFFPGTTRQGVIQLDATELWSVEARNDQPHLYSILLHEIGHVLGVEHVSHPSAAMAADYTGPVQGLTAADVQAIQRLYGSADGTVAPDPTPKFGELPDVRPALVTDVDVDSDGDGLPDRMEVLVLDTDPDNPDSDGDGIDDYTEIFQLGTPAAAERLVARARTVYPAVEEGREGLLDAEGSYDPSGWPIFYRWAQVEGPDAPLNAPNVKKPRFVAPMIERSTLLTFELTVTNAKGIRPATDRVSVWIMPRYDPNAIPVADAGIAPIAYGGREVRLDGRRSFDANGRELTFTWTQIAGPQVTLSGASADSPTFDAPPVTQTTTLTFGLTVSVPNGTGTLTDSHLVSVTVRPLEEDSDGDGLTNRDELDFYGTDPEELDSDADGYPDGADAYPRNLLFH
jgi:predicted Zn-dependent protease